MDRIIVRDKTQRKRAKYLIEQPYACFRGESLFLAKFEVQANL